MDNSRIFHPSTPPANYFELKNKILFNINRNVSFNSPGSPGNYISVNVFFDIRITVYWSLEVILISHLIEKTREGFLTRIGE